MKSTVLGVVCFATLHAAAAQEIASCRNPEGPTYFHYAGSTQKPAAGWSMDRIRGGRISLIRAGDHLDILFSDIRSKPISTTADGGKVMLIRSSGEAATVLVLYPRSTEVYTFFTESDGSSKFTMFQTKTGDSMPVPKSALLLGDCDPLSFGPLQ